MTRHCSHPRPHLHHHHHHHHHNDCDQKFWITCTWRTRLVLIIVVIITIIIIKDHRHHHDNRCHHHHHCNCDQLDLADEQAAAIRRELDARREKVQEMERVSLLIIISIRMVKIDCYCDRDLYEDDHVIITIISRTGS